jgi:hypothetical protein
MPHTASAATVRAIAIESVDPGRSVGWWADAGMLFLRCPLRWTALAAVLMVPLALVALLPAVGLYVAALLSPLAVGTWMLAADPVQRSGSAAALQLRTLWPRMKRGAHLARLLVLGAVLAGATLAMDLVSHALGIAHVLGAVPIDAPSDAVRAAQNSGMLALLLLLTFSMVVSAALWFAPALVVLHGATPRRAAAASLRAVRDNALTFLLFAVVQLLIAAAAVALHEAAWPLLLPLLLHTVVVSYRDVFAS